MVKRVLDLCACMHVYRYMEILLKVMYTLSRMG